MKRLIAVLLLLTLLCGCAATQTPSEEAVSTQSGIRVQTDYSKYTPQENLEAKYTRLSPDFISKLQPRDDYGLLYPFIGSMTVPADFYSEPAVKYGLVDASGRIVVDAVYTRVTPVQYNYMSNGDPFPMWVLNSTEGTALASFDGSFVTEPIYSRVEAFEDYVLADVYDPQGQRVTHVFDKNGNLCLDSSDWVLSDRIASIPLDADGWAPGICSYGSGLFGVYLEDGIYYADWDGNLIAGPYLFGEVFSDGYALVALREVEEDTFDTYAYIDTEGNRLWDAEFYYAETFEDGFAGASITGEDALLISAADGVILRCEGDYCEVENSIFKVRGLYGTAQFYDLTGKLLYESTDEGSYSVLEGGKFAFNSYSNIVVNLETGEVLTGEAFYNLVSAEYCGESGTLLVSNYSSDDCSYCVTDENGSILLELGDFAEYEEDAQTGEGYYLVGYDRTKIYSLKWEAPFVPGSRYNRIFGGRILCFDERGSYHYDLEGNLLFYYPYPGGYGD